jgi:antirestriction protein
MGGPEEMDENQSDSKRRMHIVSRSDCNTGGFVGRWIDANQSAEEISAEIQEMLAESMYPFAKHWAIHDYEGFCGVHLNRHECLSDVADLAQGIEEYGSVFAQLTIRFGGMSGLGKAREFMGFPYRGQYEHIADYVRELLEECFDSVLRSLPDVIRCHIDLAGIAENMEKGGDLFSIEVDGKVHVFEANRQNESARRAFPASYWKLVRSLDEERREGDNHIAPTADTATTREAGDTTHDGWYSGVVPPSVVFALTNILAHYKPDEWNHFHAGGKNPSIRHIFVDLDLVDDWLGYIAGTKYFP